MKIPVQLLSGRDTLKPDNEILTQFRWNLFDNPSQTEKKNTSEAGSEYVNNTSFKLYTSEDHVNKPRVDRIQHRSFSESAN